MEADIMRKEQLSDFGKRKKRQAGFSLIELMVVVAIMATLATVASLFFLGATDDADIAKARTEIKALKGAVTQYMLKNNRQLPNSLEEVAQYMDPPKIPKDPWGNNYIYQKEGTRKFVIMSYGADGAPGGEGVNGDISSND